MLMLDANSDLMVTRPCATCREDMRMPFIAGNYFILPSQEREALHKANIARCETCGEYIHAFCNAALYQDGPLCAHCAAEHVAGVDWRGVLWGLAFVACIIVGCIILAALPPQAFGAP